MRRVPARFRILAALGAAIVVHTFWSAEVEGARVRALGFLASVGPPGGFSPPIEGIPATPEVDARIRAWRGLRARALSDAGRVAVPVLHYLEKPQVAIIGAGRESGLDVLDPVVVPSGLLGFIEAVEPHLARVRLLAAPRARVAVALAESRHGLPGELDGLNAVLEGTGSGGRLVEGTLLSEFRSGDRIVAVLEGGGPQHLAEREVGVAAAASRTMPVGTISKAGPLPEVRLFAGPGDLGLVAVPADREPSAALFKDEVLEVRAAPLFGSGGALLLLPPRSGASPGCAIQVRGRYLGRIARVAGRSAVASRLGDPGHRIFVRILLAGSQASTGELVSAGDGTFRLEGVEGEAGLGASILAVTAGGEDLVPGDLAIGFLDKDGLLWRLRDPVSSWPAVVTVPVFGFAAELKRLLPP